MKKLARCSAPVSGVLAGLAPPTTLAQEEQRLKLQVVVAKYMHALGAGVRSEAQEARAVKVFSRAGEARRASARS